MKKAGLVLRRGVRARVTRGRVCFDDHQQPWEAGMSRKALIAAIVLIAVAALDDDGGDLGFGC